MKKPLHYAVRPTMYGPEIVAVTKERSAHWWGRTVKDDIGTHGRSSDLRGRFETIEQAEALRDQIQSVHTHYRRQVGVLDQLRGELLRAEEAMVRQIVQGVPARGAAILFVVAELRGAESA